MTLKLPRYVISKLLADGTTGFYFNIPTRYRKQVSVGTAEGFPPGGQAGEVFFPAGTDLQEKDQRMIETAVLNCYYGVEID